MKNYFKPFNLLRVGLTLLCISVSFTGCNEDELLATQDVVGPIDEKSAVVVRTNGIDPSWADAAFNGFNNACLNNSGNQSYYKETINDGNPDGTWEASLDILVAEDAYERTGSAAHRDLVNRLCATWLSNTPPPWTWDGWNDDIGWFTMALIRGYQMTGNSSFLTQARYGFDMAWARGWDTQYNGGGIWEQQPEKTPAGESISKEALSNNSLGIVACMIYQSNGDIWYRDRAIQIYDWMWHHIYNPNNGQVYAGIDRNNVVNTGTAVYNQGAFVDYANLLYKITGNVNYYNDAVRAVEYVKNNMTTGGIITNNASYLNTWADTFARGLGHLCTDNPQLWNTYGDWMVQNANAIWNNRRTDYNITWNGWANKTSNDNNLKTNVYCGGVAWLQFTPVKSTGIVSGATYSIISKHSGKAMDVEGASTANGANVDQWQNNGAGNQRWVVSSVGSNAYSITSVNSNKCLDLEGGGAANGANILQWGWNGGNNQRWLLQPDGQGYFTIVSVASGRAIDVAGNSTANGANLLQWDIHGGDNQKWSFVR